MTTVSNLYNTSGPETSDRDLTELPWSPALGQLDADHTGIRMMTAAQWIVRIVMSLAYWTHRQ